MSIRVCLDTPRSSGHDSYNSCEVSIVIKISNINALSLRGLNSTYHVKYISRSIEKKWSLFVSRMFTKCHSFLNWSKIRTINIIVVLAGGVMRGRIPQRVFFLS